MILTQWPILTLAATCCIGVSSIQAAVFECLAQETLTAVELDEEDTLRFTLRNGQSRTLTVESTDARVLLTNLPRLKQGFPGGETMYEMTCRVRIDGHPMTMRRYVPVQQSFYEPYVINGMRIWFDGVRKIDRFLNDNHGGGVPRKDVRFAIQDAGLPICPQPLRPWYPNAENYIDVGQCYNADDVWMGPYFGADLHGGLDINMPIGTPLWAPIDFDDQYYFNSLELGHNNNRWRGVRTWPDGQRWVLQAHHIQRLRVPQDSPLKQGVHYADAAGVLTGAHAHSHFVFKIGPEGDQTLLDAWIVFWQIFENNKRRANAIRAVMAPLGPQKTGEPVRFSSEGSIAGVQGNHLRHRWTFGDGGTSIEAEPSYVFTSPGIYPVRLVVDDGVQQAAFTQHITVDGETVDDVPSLVLESPDSIAFQRRPVEAMDVYGWKVEREPCVLQFTARPRSSPRPSPQAVLCRNAGGSELAEPQVEIRYREGQQWLKVLPKGVRLEVAVDASRLPDRHGVYHADVVVDCLGALNSPQVFGVEIRIPPPRERPASTVTVDNEDAGCYRTPWFWLSPQFHRHFPDRWKPGHRGSYLLSRGGATGDERVRFTPDLGAGAYRVSLSADTPFRPSVQMSQDIRFRVRVRHRDGIEDVWMEPLKSREVGIFDFKEGTEGYVEILAGGATGPVVADAVKFELQPGDP